MTRSMVEIAYRRAAAGPSNRTHRPWRHAARRDRPREYTATVAAAHSLRGADHAAGDLAALAIISGRSVVTIPTPSSHPEQAESVGRSARVAEPKARPITTAIGGDRSRLQPYPRGGLVWTACSRTAPPCRRTTRVFSSSTDQAPPLGLDIVLLSWLAQWRPARRPSRRSSRSATVHRSRRDARPHMP